MESITAVFGLEREFARANCAAPLAMMVRLDSVDTLDVRIWSVLIRLDSMDTLDVRIWSVNGLFRALQKPRSERRPSEFGL
jgi:hypothetical protein